MGSCKKSSNFSLESDFNSEESTDELLNYKNSNIKPIEQTNYSTLELFDDSVFDVNNSLNLTNEPKTFPISTFQFSSDDTIDNFKNVTTGEIEETKFKDSDFEIDDDNFNDSNLTIVENDTQNDSFPIDEIEDLSFKNEKSISPTPLPKRIKLDFERASSPEIQKHVYPSKELLAKIERNREIAAERRRRRK